jgi:hypothetical protein
MVQQAAKRRINPVEKSHERNVASLLSDLDRAILTVLSHRSKHYRHVEYGPIDQHGTDLSLADL